MNSMSSLIKCKRSKAIFFIGVIAITISELKKIITYPAEGCLKGTKELTLKLKERSTEKVFHWIIISHIQSI